MNLVPFVMIFPQQGEQETRTITTRQHHVLPDDTYALVESYCTDPKCNCRRVMLNVMSQRQVKRGYLASISFGFDRDAEMAGPYLDPLNPQSQYAGVFLDLVSQILADDPAYVARLERHYHQVKAAAADPTHPGHRTLVRLNKQADLTSTRKTRSKPKSKPSPKGKRKKRKRR